MARGSTPLRSDERPRFVARAFDVARFRPTTAARRTALLLIALIIAALVIAASAPPTPVWVDLVVYPGLGIGLLSSVAVATVRLDLTTSAVRTFSWFGARQVDWTDVRGIETWSDVPIPKRHRFVCQAAAWPGALGGGICFAVVVARYYGPWSLLIGCAAMVGWIFVFSYLHYRLRFGDVSTVRLSLDGGRVVRLRMAMTTREFVRLKRHLRRCALQHGIEPPW